LDRIETGEAEVSASLFNGDADADVVIGFSFVCVGVDGVKTGLLGCSEMGERVGIAGVDELRL
jgi:hypothetical protein